LGLVVSVNTGQGHQALGPRLVRSLGHGGVSRYAIEFGRAGRTGGHLFGELAPAEHLKGLTRKTWPEEALHCVGFTSGVDGVAGP